MKYLTPFSHQVIGFPAVHEDTIVFTASEGRLDRLFMIAGGQLYRLQPDQASRFTGHYQAQVAYGRYAYAAFTAVGDLLQQGRITENNIVPVDAAVFSGIHHLHRAFVKYRQEIEARHCNGCGLIDACQPLFERIPALQYP